MQPEPQAPPPAGDETHASTDILIVVLLYAVFAALWILLSDLAVEWLFGDAAQITLVSTLKGWLFVGVTSLLLHGLLRRLFGRAGAAAASVAGWRPFLLSLALLAAPIAALTAIGIANVIQNQKAQEIVRLQAIADLKTQQLNDWLRERRGNAGFIQASRFWAELYHRWRDADDLASRDLLQSQLNQLRESGAFQGILLLDEQGEPLWDATGGSLAIDPVLRTAARQAAVNHQVSQFGPYLDAAGRPRLDFVAALPTLDDRPDPVIVLRADPADYLFPTLQTWPVPSASGEILLFRRDGDQILYLNELRHRADTALKLRLPVAGNQVLAAQAARGEAPLGSLVEGVDYRGVPALGVVRAVPGTDWFLVAKLDQAELYVEATGDIIQITLTGLLALFGIAAGAVLFRQRQQLAASRQEQKIQAEKQRALQLLDAIAQSSTDIIFAKDVESRYLLFNREATRVTGKSAEAVLGRDDTTLFPPEQAALIRASDRQVMADNRAVTLQQDLVTVDGGQRTFLTTNGPLHNAAGQTIGLFGISRDITERQRAETEICRLNAELEERIRQRTAELEAANQELASFAYAVSHDLRAPLRAMSGFSQALLEDYGERLEGEARIYLDQIIIASHHMSELIDGILTLSRSTRGELRRDPVDLAALAEWLLAERAAAEPERRVAWRVEPGLRVRGDPVMLEVVMRNLIENAWKYTAKTPNATIRVYSENKEDERCFCVADNGAGFDMAHANRLFKAFQRLHRQDEFPGIGIGLATVQRIIHRHGGVIHAESAPGCGATFRFTLPSAEALREETS